MSRPSQARSASGTGSRFAARVAYQDRGGGGVVITVVVIIVVVVVVVVVPPWAIETTVSTTKAAAAAVAMPCLVGLGEGGDGPAAATQSGPMRIARR